MLHICSRSGSASRHILLVPKTSPFWMSGCSGSLQKPWVLSRAQCQQKTSSLNKTYFTPSEAHKPQDGCSQMVCPVLRHWVAIQVVHPCPDVKEQGHWLSGPHQVSFCLTHSPTATSARKQKDYCGILLEAFLDHYNCFGIVISI